MAEQGGTGVKLKITVGTVLTAIVNLLDVNFPEQTKTLADFTSHPTSGATAYMERIDTGLRELTPFEAVVGWDSADSTHAAVLTAFDATSAVSMSIEDPAGTEVIAFSAHIQRVGRVAKLRDGYKANITIAPTGAPSIT